MAEITLRPYQEEAVTLIVDRLNVLLALVMGAGKTVVSIEAVKRLRQEEPMLQATVFATSSLKYQWQAEINKFDPEASVVVIDGDKAKRHVQYRNLRYTDYVILSYDMLIHDWDMVRKYLPRDAVIADEVTAIKGFTSKRSKRLKSFSSHSPVRIGLSGQPVENRPEELFSIMEFIDPTVLGSFDQFDRTFITRNHWGKPVRYKNLGIMHSRLDNVMYRKSRADIAEFMPDRVETDMPVQLDPASRAVYDYIAEDLIGLLGEAAKKGLSGFDLAAHYGKKDDPEHNVLKGQIMSRMTCMRLLTAHPKVLLESAHDFGDDTTNRGSGYAKALLDAGMLSGLPDSSAKETALVSWAKEVLRESPNNKVVIFSGFKRMLSVLGPRLSLELSEDHVFITGDTPSIERQARIDRFNNDPNCRLFFSSDAGAYGVNLQAGTHLINYDFPWSSGALAQRVARIDRTSSTHEYIDILYMYAVGTVDQYQLNVLREKSKVATAFIDADGYDAKGNLDLSVSGLSDFLVSYLYTPNIRTR